MAKFMMFSEQTLNTLHAYRYNTSSSGPYLPRAISIRRVHFVMSYDLAYIAACMS